jgi:hypothetical protein
MIYNSIEEELWRIFTFYALHSDPTMPETLRPPNFIKFCKDCQIISKKFPPSSVELEIARLARQKSQGAEYILTNNINFLDFMTLLEVLAVKVRHDLCKPSSLVRVPILSKASVLIMYCVNLQHRFTRETLETSRPSG